MVNNRISDELRQRFQYLSMLVVDHEASDEEKKEFFRMVEQYPEFNSEWAKFQNLKEVIHTMKFKTLPDEVWDRHWLGIYNRIERGLAWILFSIGAVILISYGVYHFIEAVLADTQIGGVLKVGIIAIVVGLVILLVSVIREKLSIRKKDPYKEVQR